MIIPKSYRSPQLILFYSDWCFACLQVEPTWRRLMDELEPLGVGLSTAHAEREPAMARKLGIHSLPCLVVTFDGRTSVYKESLFSVQKVVGKTIDESTEILFTRSVLFFFPRRIPQKQIPIQDRTEREREQRAEFPVRLGR